MAANKISEVDSVAARQVWEDFQREHDLSGRQGQTAGIEPASARIWFGGSIEQVIQQRDADGCEAPLYFVRVGAPAYYRKGGRR